MNDLNNQELRKSYGTETENVEQIKKEEAFQKIIKLLPTLFKIDSELLDPKNPKELPENEYKQIMDLFKILKHDKETSPYLIELIFNGNLNNSGAFDGVLSEIQVHPDPHFKKVDKMSEALVGNKFDMPDIQYFIKRQKTLFGGVNSLIKTAININKKSKKPDSNDVECIYIGIAGTNEGILAIARMNPDFLTRENNQPLYSILIPNTPAVPQKPA